MSLRALPLQFLNLGGEMMYVIDQRLRAQGIASAQANKVRNDIVGIMLNRRFVEELFKPQALYSVSALRTVFDKLAHASIMRLNAPSMDKLFDLMLMALKQQMLVCSCPREVLLITLNHLDALRGYATLPQVVAQVEAAMTLFRQTYLELASAEVWEARLALLAFVQDLRIRVSVFLKQHLQTPTGTLALPLSGPVPHGCEVPGVVRVMGQQGEVTGVHRFPPVVCFAPPLPPGSLTPCGDRGTSLGTNMYADPPEDSSHPHTTQTTMDMHTPHPGDIMSKGPMRGRGMDELNLLAQLIGSASTNNRKEFRLNLFPSEEESEAEFGSEAGNGGIGGSVITIEGRSREARPELGRILSELSDPPDDDLVAPLQDKGQDLLDLMDSA